MQASKNAKKKLQSKSLQALALGGNDNQGKDVKLCLNMIVRDEKDNIARCFDTVAHMIDAIAVVDTGSKDNTIEIMTKYMQDHQIAGEVISRPWVNFGHNRTEAIRHGEAVIAKLDPENKCVWYFMFMDADNQAKGYDGTSKYNLDKTARNQMTHDCYDVEMRSGDSAYNYPWLIRINPTKKWKWYKSRHEYPGPEGDWKETKAVIGGGYVISGREGYRSKNPLTYLEDAFEFLKDLKVDPNDHRAMFYAAQSMRDAKLPDIARILYRQRYEAGGWNEEAYMSMLHLALERYYKSDFGPKTMSMLMDAFEKCPHRYEAPYYIVKAYRLQGKHHLGWNFAKGLIDKKPNFTALFLDRNITEWGFFEEAGLCAYYAGDKASYKMLLERVLECKLTPEDVRQRVRDNLVKFK
jgi:glycosyltransferase involved in cell wall biosynthesis